MKKKESLYIGIDISSTNIKVGAYDHTGALKAVSSTPTPVHMTKSGGIYHLPDELREKTVNTILACMERVQGHKIKAIGVSSVAEAGVILDEDGEPLGQIMAWYDQRPNPCLEAVKSRVPALDFYRKTGMKPEAIHTLLKFVWMKEHMAEVWARGRKWLHIAEYIVYCLTGETKTEHSLASRSLLFNINERQWDADLIREFHIKEELLQENVQAGKVHGYVHKAASAFTKIPEGTPVTIAGHHPIVGAFGIGGMLDGDVTDISEMMEALIITVPSPNMDHFAEPQKFTVGCHVLPNQHYALMDVGRTGGVIEWFLSITGWDSQKLLTVLSKANGINHSLGFYPVWTGDQQSGNPVQTAWFGGHITNSNPELMATSIIQGLSCLFRNRIEELRSLNIPFKRLMVAGESAKYSYWMQMKADFLNLPLHVCRNWEGSSRGAAILAAKSIDEIGEFFIPPSLTLTPNKDKIEEMEKYYTNNYLKNLELFKQITIS